MNVIIAAPATVANLGPGFDIFGLALQLQNEVRAESADTDGLTVDPGPDAPAELADAQWNLVTRAYAYACEAKLGVPATGVHFRCINRIPIGRGLGSSAAASLCGVLAAVALQRAPWDEEAVLDCVAELEGHRDNAAAALLGGLAICTPSARTTRMDVPEELHAVLFVPDAQVKTTDARRVVPQQFSRDDAVFNAARCALLVRCFAQPDYSNMAEAMRDRWHQDARSALMPGTAAMIAAAVAAGAAGASLAGSGPSVLALTPLDPAPVEAALGDSARRSNIDGRTMVLRVRNFGARVDVHA
jgi:homoserine kinase